MVTAASPPANDWFTPKKNRRMPPLPLFAEKLAMTGGVWPPSNDGAITPSLREMLISAVGGFASRSSPALDLVMNRVVLYPTQPLNSTSGANRTADFIRRLTLMGGLVNCWLLMNWRQKAEPFRRGC